MRAEKDDIPNYLRPKKKSHKRFFIAAGATSAIFWALVTLYAKPIVIDLNLLWAAVNPKTPTPPVQNTYQSQAPTLEEIPPTKSAEALFWENVARKENAQSEVRQTEFNDLNYTQRGAVNVISAPTAQYASTTKVAQQQRQVARTRHVNNFEWEISKGRKRWGQFEWVDVNGEIEWDSVCQNLKRGSFEYRDCRKGAKVRFKEICGSYRPACRAENNFMP